MVDANVDQIGHGQNLMQDHLHIWVLEHEDCYNDEDSSSAKERDRVDPYPSLI